ncbi:protein YoaJ [Klebsiella michiganensis]|nr:protein YoaJ [Klebsiella michiganensis]MBZ7601464.1 protein YoaJ [Klebsiella michiganensis]
MKKSTIIMLIVAIVAVAGTQLGWWKIQDYSRVFPARIAELSHLLNKLKAYTHLISRWRMPVFAHGFNWRSEK